MGCLPPEEKVFTGTEWKSINSLNVGDHVINSSGDKTKIKKVNIGSFNGKMIKIIPFVSSFNEFSVTFYHPVLAIKRKFLKSSRVARKNCDFLRINEKELLSFKPVYVEAEYLEKGDYLVFPKLRHIKDDAKFSVDIMRLLGYYLAEGYISPERVINFAFNKEEKYYIDDVKKIVKKVFNKETSQRTRGNVTELRVCSVKISKFLLEHCGKYALEKKLSEEILSLPFKKQFEMIRTLINGDGNVYKRREQGFKTFRLDTASQTLAVQVQEILARCGIFSSIKKFERPSTLIEGRLIGPHTLFNVSFQMERKHKFFRETKDYFLVPIRQVKLSDYYGDVFNLEVQKGNSYLAKGFAVHNCAAAIATSSMITELAKGKTLAEAEKITNKDVADKLNGLPPIKMHCSNLAADALKIAIKNYRKK